MFLNGRRPRKQTKLPGRPYFRVRGGETGGAGWKLLDKQEIKRKELENSESTKSRAALFQSWETSVGRKE